MISQFQLREVPLQSLSSTTNFQNLTNCSRATVLGTVHLNITSALIVLSHRNSRSTMVQCGTCNPKVVGWSLVCAISLKSIEKWPSSFRTKIQRFGLLWYDKGLVIIYGWMGVQSPKNFRHCPGISWQLTPPKIVYSQPDQHSTTPLIEQACSEI